MTFRVFISDRYYAIRDRIVKRVFRDDLESAYADGYETGADDALNNRIPHAERGVSIGHGMRAHVVILPEREYGDDVEH